MRQMGLKAQWIKPFTHTTIDSDCNIKLENILEEPFNPDAPNTVWISDITYIWTKNEGFVYLTSIIAAGHIRRTVSSRSGRRQTRRIRFCFV